MKRYYLFLILFVLVTPWSSAQMSIEDELYAAVMAIEGRSHIGRNEFIKEQLQKSGIGYVTAPFRHVFQRQNDTIVISGENIIVRVGHGAKRIVIGAHYDAAAESPGANDNGSGVAVLLSLIKHLQDNYWNYGIDFCFFDQEEMGSMGAIYYIKQFIIPKKHLVMINLDIEGSGEELYVGPVGMNTRFVMRYVREAGLKTGFPFVEFPEFPASDHVPFGQLNLENIAISVVPKGDAARLSKFVKNGYKSDSADVPQVMKVMHSVDDRSNFVTPSALKMSFEYTRTLLLLLNESKR
jgi:hypothetical protein